MDSRVATSLGGCLLFRTVIGDGTSLLTVLWMCLYPSELEREHGSSLETSNLPRIVRVVAHRLADDEWGYSFG